MFVALSGVASMESKSEALKPAQTALVTTVPISLKVLKNSFSPSELGAIAKGVLNAFPVCAVRVTVCVHRLCHVMCCVCCVSIQSNSQALNKLNLVVRLLKGTIGEDKGQLLL
jgi:hypothetical protein